MPGMQWLWVLPLVRVVLLVGWLGPSANAKNATPARDEHPGYHTESASWLTDAGSSHPGDYQERWGGTIADSAIGLYLALG